MLIQKNKLIKLEYGDYGNYQDFIPLQIARTDDKYKQSAILFQYPHTDKTIVLWCNDNEIDKESFKCS